MVDIATIRKYNVPAGVPNDNITEHLTKATAERTRRLGFSSYTGAMQTEYDEILIHLTLKRIYNYEDTFFINGIPEEVNDIKVNARFFSRTEIDQMIAGQEREASELISSLKQSIVSETGEIVDVGGFVCVSVGGNPEFKKPAYIGQTITEESR